jgi:hypothetical protein
LNGIFGNIFNNNGPIVIIIIVSINPNKIDGVSSCVGFIKYVCRKLFLFIIKTSIFLFYFSNFRIYGFVPVHFFVAAASAAFILECVLLAFVSAHDFETIEFYNPLYVDHLTS